MELYYKLHKMEVKFADLKTNYLSIKEEINAEYHQLFENCDFIHGSKVHIFEENFAKYIDAKHFIGCANGTDALELAIQCLDISSNDEVIVQGNTYIASCLGVLNNNIKLVLCDIDPLTQMVDINDLKKRITPNTKAIIIVHLYGIVPNMDDICSLCKDNNLFLIEDCAQAHGASWNNKKVGSFGDISCFSFYPGKNLGAYGDGGGIGTNSDEFNEKIRKLMNLGCKVKYHHELIGRNSRLDTLQAGFLNVKLKYLEGWNESRRKHANLYNKLLNSVGDIETPVVDERCIPVFHLYVIKTKYRDELQCYLKSKNITCLIHYPISVPETEAMQKYNFTGVDNCINNSKLILSLPMFPEMTEADITYVCDNIIFFFFELTPLKLNSIVTINKPGTLNCLNNMKFNTKRIFYIDQFTEKDLSLVRGLHANTNFNEVLLVIQGKIQLKLISQNLSELNHSLIKNDSIFIPKMKWIEFEILDKDTIIMCLADETYDKSISISDFDVFKNFV